MYRRGGHAWSSGAPSWRGGTRAKIVSRLSSSTAERGTLSGIAMASFCPKSVRTSVLIRVSVCWTFVNMLSLSRVSICRTSVSMVSLDLHVCDRRTRFAIPLHSNTSFVVQSPLSSSDESHCVHQNVQAKVRWF